MSVKIKRDTNKLYFNHNGRIYQIFITLHRLLTRNQIIMVYDKMMNHNEYNGNEEVYEDHVNV